MWLPKWMKDSWEEFDEREQKLADNNAALAIKFEVDWTKVKTINDIKAILNLTRAVAKDISIDKINQERPDIMKYFKRK